ncbi:MAG: endonuclease/exonuclease/phosphatase family protein [Acidobacteriota bacterium]
MINHSNTKNFFIRLMRLRQCSFSILFAMLMCFPTFGIVEKPSSDIRVMSFNIRYGTANDGENRWDNRKDFLVATIKAFDPDLLGTQETLAFQRDFLAKELPQYDVFGVGRDDGRERGEMTALYYKRERFEKLDGGHFWLSETPEQPGSKSWDTAITRMVSWVKLRDRRYPKAKPLVFFNTHFDHRGEAARLESARLLRRRAAEMSKTCSVIVTGDFNAGEASEPYKALFGADDKKPMLLRDSFRIAHPARSENEGTFSDFKAETTTGARIDWIAISKEWQVIRADIDRAARNGRTPSDHFAMTAVLRLR